MVPGRAPPRRAVDAPAETYSRCCCDRAGASKHPPQAAGKDAIPARCHPCTHEGLHTGICVWP